MKATPSPVTFAAIKRPVRILHFSDIHFGRPALSFGALFDKRLLGGLNYRLRRRDSVDESRVERLVQRCAKIAPDVIVCSGDITCVGSPAEFRVACEALEPLVEKTGATFLYVPGNHDAYVANRACGEALTQACRQLVPAFAEPRRPFAALTVGEVDIGVVEEARPTNIFLSTGRLSAEAARQMQAWCAADATPRRTRVLIGHFPLRDAQGAPLGWRRHLVGGERIERLLVERKIDAYLCGHIHTPYIRRLAGGAVECCAGSLTIKGVFAVLDLDRHGRVEHRWETI